MIDWQPLARNLAALLADQGALTPAWRTAFEQTPRHRFVPRFHTPDGALVDSDDPDQQAAWLAAVYADESLITQVRTTQGSDLPWPTSSSTRPALMARMLDLLSVADGHRVLEIGTGTGYNAALLCHRLGDQTVNSIDIDPGLIDVARERLAHLGYRPNLAAGNGANGIPDRAPYQRIIATCGVSAIPSAWITQLDDDGVIVADLRGEVSSTLVAVRKVDGHTVQGRFQSTPGHFMWLRPTPEHPLRQDADPVPTFDLTDPATEATFVPLAALDDPDFRLVLQVAVPGLGPVGRTLLDGAPGRLLALPVDGSWAEVSEADDGTVVVRSGGPGALWDTVADAWYRWRDWGSPTRDRFGLTAHDDGRHVVWLDDPSHSVLTAPLAADR